MLMQKTTFPAWRTPSHISWERCCPNRAGGHWASGKPHMGSLENPTSWGMVSPVRYPPTVCQVQIYAPTDLVRFQPGLPEGAWSLKKSILKIRKFEEGKSRSAFWRRKTAG